MTEDAIGMFRRSQKEFSRKQSALKRAEREAMWERLTVPIRQEWARIVGSGGMATLNNAYDTMLNQSKNRRIFRRSKKDFENLAILVEKSKQAIEELSREAAFSFAAVVPAKDQGHRQRADALLTASANLRSDLEKVRRAADEFLDALPEQAGGQGVLSDQVLGHKMRFFREFAEASRDIWRAAGLSIGGNGVIDQGFSDFLDAVHADVFGCSIPSRAALLASLRNTWPGPRIS